MDYRALYKLGNSNVLNSTAKTRRNLKLNQERSTKRNDLFLSGRNLKDSIIKNNDERREKVNRIDRKTKQEAYLEKYLAWKAEKDKLKASKQVKPRPFVSAVKSSLGDPAYKFDPPTGRKDVKVGKVAVSKKTNKNEQIMGNTKQKQEEGPKVFRKPLAPLKTNIPASKQNCAKIVNPTQKNTNNKQQKTVYVKENVPRNRLRPPKLIISASESKTPNKDGKASNQDINFGGMLSNFFTSTGRKSQNPKLSTEEDFGEIISPIDSNLSVEAVPSQANRDLNKEPKRKSRNAQRSLISPSKDDNEISKPVSLNSKNAQDLQCENITSTSAGAPLVEPLDLNTTPTNENDNRPSNYMSPFVTVSRGKVSAKKEREKRESIYKLEESSPGEPIEVRRIRESVKYFRKILNDEISRLHSRCDFWDLYKRENAPKIEEVGSDMISATVGQTKLLTSKKLEQFRGLIDRCEQSISQKKPNESDQVILPEDLEGFWSMVRLQIENVDRRFESLDRWKANDWIDPDEEKPKTKKNLTKGNKIKKAKPKPAKPNEQLKELLKKAQAFYRKNKNNNALDNDVVLVVQKNRLPSNRRSNSNTPVRRSSKQLESALTDSTKKQSSEKRRNSETPAKRRNSTTPRRSKVVAGRSLLVSTLNKTHEKKSLEKRLSNSPLIVPRKSILKTPGTKKKQNQRVFFNDKLDYNSPESLMSGIGVLTDDDSVLQRSMHLRSRRIIMRPDIEIEIP